MIGDEYSSVSCDISGNSVYKNGTCPDPTSLRCLPHLSHLKGRHGTDGCGTPLIRPPTAPGDVKALCDLYFATGGASWKRSKNTGFDTCNPNGTAGSDPCSDPGFKWADQYGSHYGVTCDTTGQSSRVTQL